MRQQSLHTDGFEKYRKPTRKEIFLKDMEQIIPWKELCQVIKPYYPKPKGAGESSRVYRRQVCLSQATMADSSLRS